MLQRIWLPFILLATIILSQIAIAEQSKPFNPKDLEFSTFSICAIDPETGESGVAVTTRVAFVGRRVAFVRAGVGAVATQSYTIVEYGPQGLDLMEKGIAPKEALEKLLVGDQAPDRRQVGLINMTGESAAHTGEGCSAWAGSRQGKNYTVQANIMVGPEVIDAVTDFFEKTEGTGMPLAERLVLALEAGQKEGGDKRWGLMQSAALKIADPNSPVMNGSQISLDIAVGENPHPVQELKRIYYRTGNHLGWREFSEIKGNDVIELQRMLHKLGYWRPELETFPPTPIFEGKLEWKRADPDKYDQAYDKLDTEYEKLYESYGIFDEETINAVDKFRKDHKINYTGNPKGLVDMEFITALRMEYYTGKN
jgi:uncharacterized Ntn-hydrolase superfamily protein